MTFSTFGELRRELASEGLTWTVNPNFSDETQIPRPALGADFTRWPLATAVPRVDISAVVAANPTTNTLLRNYLATRGLLEPIRLQAEPVLGSVGPLAQTGAMARTAGLAGASAGPPAGAAPPNSVDWRSRFGWPWITQIRDQDPCEHGHQGPDFGAGIAAMGATLIQSTWGNLELVAVLTDGQMQHWWRNDGGTNAWFVGGTFGAGISASSPPVMIQGQYGMANEYGNGNFELCVALPDGTVQHWWRNNEVPSLPWSLSATFGSDVDCVVALVEGSFGFNLELIVLRRDGMLQHYWRAGGVWNAGVVIGPA